MSLKHSLDKLDTGITNTHLRTVIILSTFRSLQHELLTIRSSKFTGVDPENPNFGYPIPTNVTLGINVSF